MIYLFSFLELVLVTILQQICGIFCGTPSDRYHVLILPFVVLFPSFFHDIQRGPTAIAFAHNSSFLEERHRHSSTNHFLYLEIGFDKVYWEASGGHLVMNLWVEVGGDFDFSPYPSSTDSIPFYSSGRKHPSNKHYHKF